MPYCVSRLCFPIVQTSQWTHEEVLALLCSYEQHKDEFDNPTIRKGEVWVHIADDLSSGHIQKTPSLCEKKWSNLKIRYMPIVNYKILLDSVWIMTLIVMQCINLITLD